MLLRLPLVIFRVLKYLLTIVIVSQRLTHFTLFESLVSKTAAKTK